LGLVSPSGQASAKDRLVGLTWQFYCDERFNDSQITNLPRQIGNQAGVFREALINVEVTSCELPSLVLEGPGS
jgi:hypothetical protein